MAQVPTTTMRLDEDTKAAAKRILEELGLNLSSATNIFLKAVVRTGGMPFDLTLDNPPDSRDYVAEYLAPFMSQRNIVCSKSRKDMPSLRKRLELRRIALSVGRRTVQ